MSRSRSRSRSRRQKKVSLDRRENLDGFQKLVSTRRTFSISISIGLDVETTRLIFRLYFLKIELVYFMAENPENMQIICSSQAFDCWIKIYKILTIFKRTLYFFHFETKSPKLIFFQGWPVHFYYLIYYLHLHYFCYSLVTVLQS